MIAAAATSPVLSGCSSDDNTTTTPPKEDGGHDAGRDGARDATSDHKTAADAPSVNSDAGPGSLTKVTKAGAFTAIFDAVPDPAGTTVYFTGIDAKGNVGVYSVPATGGAATAVQTGAPFTAPFGITISSDGKTLYVADPGLDGGSDLGEIVSLPVGGGTPKAVSGSADAFPRAITIDVSSGKDELVYTGVSTKTGALGVFQLPISGGTPTSLAEGAPFVDPSGVAVDGKGDVYVLDTQASKSYRGAIFKVSKSAATVFATDLWVGYPAGIAFTVDGKGLVVSGLEAAEGPDAVWSFTVAGGVQTSLVSADHLSSLTNAAGLHRAADVNVFAFVDSAGDGTDAVYVIN
jgi:sugar lactone lactonase YvrE